MSTTDQMKGDSLRRQDKATRQYALENGLELVELIDDQGVSAFEGKNAVDGKLAYFLERAKSGDIEPGSVLIVESLDRISRQNLLNAMALFNQIIECGVTIVTLMDRQEYSKHSISQNPYDSVMAVMTLLRAHEESKTKSERLSAAWSNKRNLARTGKVTVQRLPHWLDFTPDRSKIIVLPERAKVIKEVFELCCAGWGTYSIAKNLNHSGVKTWGRAKFWQESYIRKLLTNRAVLGEFQPYTKKGANSAKRQPEGKSIPDYFPAVIDPVLFAEAQEASARRRTSGKGRKGKNFSNLFTGLLRCRNCHSGMRYLDKGAPPKGGQYLRCSKTLVSKGCDAPPFRYEDVERGLLKFINNLNVEAILNGPEWVEKTSDLKRRRLEIDQQISENVFQLENLVTAIAQGSPAKILMDKIAELETRQSVLAQENTEIIEKLSELSVSRPTAYQELIKRLETAKDDTDQVALRRKINDEIKKIVSHIAIGPRVFDPFDFAEENLEIDDDFPKGKTFFQAVIAYRTSSVQTYDSMLDKSIFFESSDKMNLLIHRTSISKID